ncbi:MAG: PfkB family carbohydrate kinase, partial [Verrucomicrobiota bacterium]
VGARLAFTRDLVFSSSHLINRHLDVLPEQTRAYLRLFRNRTSSEALLGTVEAMRDLNVLVIGDAIVDEYIYGEALGKSSKDPVMVMRKQAEERYPGGSLLVANQVANFTGRTDLLCLLGDHAEQRNFIEAQIGKNVTPRFFTRTGSATLVKRRMVESYSLNKLLEIYIHDEGEPPKALQDEIAVWLDEHLDQYDLVLCTDYGHGLLTAPLVDRLCQQARFLAVNTQANAGNRGFHTIRRYPRADIACIAEHEIRLEARQQQGDLQPLMDDVAASMGDPLFIVTRGKNGCLVRAPDGHFIELPALTAHVVDRVGAGDAFLAMAALATATGADPESIGFLGNLAGAQAVAAIGSNQQIDARSLQRHLHALLK